MELRNNIINCVTKLNSLLPLGNAHMVNFLTDNMFESHVPSIIKDEIMNLDIDDLNKIVFNSFSASRICDERALNLINFLTDTHKLSLKNNNLCLSLSKLCEVLESKGLSHCEFNLAKNLMSQKKSHEVEMMSGVVSACATAEEFSHIVDIGGGKGYLSSVLTMKYNYKVLTVDSSFTTSKGAVKQIPKVEKLWNTHDKKHSKLTDISDKDSTAKVKEISSKLCKVATHFITENSNILELLRNYFPEDEVINVMLVGLHTCGNLASTSLRLFAENPTNFRCLVNVGCCYNLIVEEFEENAGIKPQADIFGFPMSKLLRDSKFVLGRNARMLAAQPPDRRLHEGTLQTDALFYRALLELLLREKLDFPNGMPQFRVGKLAGKCSNFIDYVHKSMQRLGLDIKLDDTELQNLYDRHAESKKQLHAFFLMRLALAPAIEAAILLDRLTYLHEQGIDEAYLTQLFDPVVSPRCFAIIAFQNSSQNVS